MQLRSIVTQAVLALLLPVALGAHACADEAAPRLDADVLVQAGHEGRPDCDREPATLCNALGARGEIDWTPIVADEATRVLRAAGLTVLRERANLENVSVRVRDAVFIHSTATTSRARRPRRSGFRMRRTVGRPRRTPPRRPPRGATCTAASSRSDSNPTISRAGFASTTDSATSRSRMRPS